MELVHDDLVFIRESSSSNGSFKDGYPPRGTGRRKGHRKSRGGCLRCKERKVKCQETRPCGNCVRRGLSCEYVSTQPPQRTKKWEDKTKVVALRANSLDPTPTTFDMLDMRIFHHYMTIAYPYLPLGTEQKWLHEIPAQAHSYEYLMHAILALGASNLNNISQEDCRKRGNHHRLLAIKGLNKAMSQEEWFAPNTDAMLATVYALTLQCGFEGSGLGELFTLIRGCVAVSVQIGSRFLPSVLVNWSHPPDHAAIMEPFLLNLPLLDPIKVQDCLNSLLQVRALCEREFEINYMEAMIKTVGILKYSSKDAYKAFTNIYTVVMLMDSKNFRDWSDLDFGISALLQAHLLALQALMVPILCREKSGRLSFPSDNRFLTVWFPKVYEACPSHLKQYLDWPKRFCVPLIQRYKVFSMPTLLGINDGAQTQMLIDAMWGDRFPYRTTRAEMSLGARPSGFVVTGQESGSEDDDDLSQLNDIITRNTPSEFSTHSDESGYEDDDIKLKDILGGNTPDSFEQFIDDGSDS